MSVENYIIIRYCFKHQKVWNKKQNNSFRSALSVEA